jgi:hypothetical protein
LRQKFYAEIEPAETECKKMSSMEWEDPPNPPTGRRGTVLYEEEAEELQANPLKWGILETFGMGDYSKAQELRGKVNGGTVSAFRPRGSFQAVVRTHRDPEGDKSKDRCKVHARYIGEDGSLLNSEEEEANGEIAS